MTHFLGVGWSDNFGDRLMLDVRGNGTNVITWRHGTSTVTFYQDRGWRSTGNKFEVVDRGASPADGFGRWLVRTTDDTTFRHIWTFDEMSYVYYNGTTIEKIGRPHREALSRTATDATGFYGYTINWTADGHVQDVVDTLGRSLELVYTSPTGCTGSCTLQTVTSIKYRPAASATPITIANLSYYGGGQWLDRVSWVGSSSYRRFRYWNGNCIGCNGMLTHVIAPHTSTATPAAAGPVLSGEVVLEFHQFETTPNQPGARARVIASSGPGRYFAYSWTDNIWAVTQYDLHQSKGPCASGTCPTGSECRSVDNTCYFATYMRWADAIRLPEGRTATYTSTSGGGGGGGSSSPMKGNVGYDHTMTLPHGYPVFTEDASDLTTSLGFDDSGRARCIVRGDDDHEAFATPTQPNTSTCAGPSTAQIIQVDYSSGTTTKTTPSLLSGNVTTSTTTNFGSTMTETTTTSGQTRDITGALQAQAHSTVTTFDAYGRVIEVNGPLPDGTALDKTTTTYNTTFNASWPFDFGQVSQVTRYVGTSTSSTPITETYSEYDAFGIPHRVVGANGQATTFTPGSIPGQSGTDRRLWTVRECAAGPGCTTAAVTTVILNGEGTVRSVTDPDNVCTTYRYIDGTTYIGAPTRIRRADASSSCGVDITDTLANSGEVELRTYMAGEPDRLQSITRRMNGTQEYILDGFVYDEGRRLTSAPFQSGASTPFSVLYTDVLQTGVVAPGGPSAGSWRTETVPDEFGRPSALQRFIDSSNKITHTLSYASPWSPRPTTLTRGENGAATSTTTFEYDDFGRLIDATVPEAGAPGSPAPTRFEYDVADQLIKKRVGSGTAMVRTDLRSYDSLGRLLSVDNDTEHAVDCSTAPAGTPIQDEEYKYDSCGTPDLPSGFACGNALGRLTIARSVLQCGSSATVVKRGRWFDYDAMGRVVRVAYATVTGATVGTPAIASYTYSTGGRLKRSGSPLNSAYDTSYILSSSIAMKVSSIRRATETTNLATALTYRPFGPLKSFTTDSAMVAGTTTRKLRWDGSAGTNYAPSGFAWTYDTTSGPGADIALMNQAFTRTDSGLLQTRTDSASSVLSRAYSYDALARLTGETMTIGGVPWLKGAFAFGNGQSSTEPADARTNSAVRLGDVNLALLGDGDGYVSQSAETTVYASGSTQPQSITRDGGDLIFEYDDLGRRTAEYDESEPTNSRRNYTYLPNGQLGTIESVGTGAEFAMRYDEAGHPLTISESYSGTPYNLYELFWEGDRLVSAQISLVTPRPFPTATPCTAVGGCFSYSTIRWHYHYLGSTLIAATQEKVHVDSTVTSKLFWVLTDERGLVHRLVDMQGQTWWQAHWDANGVRSWIGTPQPDIWVPFGLPGQVVLSDYPFEFYAGIGTRMSGSEATIRPSSVSASASSSDVGTTPANAIDKSLTTRWSSNPSDNEWIAIDLGSIKPLSGVRLTWDTAYGDGYQIDVADEETGPWSSLYATSTGDGGVDEISFDTSARYVRLSGTHRATMAGYALWEFEVFGPWTRPPIALNGWRASDPLLMQFVQPDVADAAARVLPEGYTLSRGNTLRFSDVDGRSSREFELALGRQFSQYLFDDNCSDSQREETLAALGKAWLNLGSCTKGLCGVPSFKRTLMFQLSRGSISCDYDPMAISRGGFGQFIYPDTTKTGYGRSELMEERAFGQFGPGLNSYMPRRYLSYQRMTLDWVLERKYPMCLANLLAHETSHPTLDLVPTTDWTLINPPLYREKPRGMSQSKTYTFQAEEDAIKETMILCDVCK